MQKTLGQDSLVSRAMARAIGRWRRCFYGGEVPAGAHPTALAAALTGYLAALVTAELSVKITGTLRGSYLASQMQRALPQMTRAVQLAAVEGQCVLRPVVRDGGIRVELIPADRFYPTRMDGEGRVTAGYFADFRRAGKEELVRLESFDASGGGLRLRNQAFRLSGDTLTGEIPLDSLEEWKDLEKELLVEHAPGPLFGVIRMPFLNQVDPASSLPVSLYAGAEQSLGEFDRLYGEFLYELHSGKRKRILERQALPGLSGKPVPGALGYQDLAADTYLVLDPMEQQKPFDDYSPVLRTGEYGAAIKSLLHLIETQCHLSPGALTLEAGDGVPATATEVLSRDRTTYRTCAAVQEQGLRPGLTDLITAMDVLCDLYDLAPAGDYQVSISFGDSVFEDTGAEFARQLQMVEAGVMQPEKLLEWYFGPDRDQTGREA